MKSILINSIVQIFELLSIHEGLLIKQFADKVNVIFSQFVKIFFLLWTAPGAIIGRR